MVLSINDNLNQTIVRFKRFDELKKMTIIVIISVSSIFFNSVYSQCEYEPLTTQQEVDNFPKKYRNCKKFRYLTIRDDNGKINNLDSLKNLEEIELITFVDSMNTTEDISGLDNLKKVGSFKFNIHRNYPSLKSIDTVRSILFLTFNDSIDLRIFGNVRYIDRHIVLHANTILKGLGNFTSGEVLDIAIIDNHLHNTMVNIVPYNGQERLSLTYWNVKNLSTKGIERGKKVDRLSIRTVSHCDFRELYNIPQMDTLIIRVQRDTLDYQQGFVNITSLKRLELDTIEVGGDLVPLLPALEYVEEYISITNSSDIRNLDFLSRLRVSIPPPSKDPDPYLVVRNNPNLTGCVNPFICNLLRSQPNRVILENNGAGCDKATILASCLTSTTDTGSDEGIVAYPNPFHEELTIPSNDHLNLMAIYNTAGQRMELDYLDKDRLDTSTWPEGMYILQYLHGDKVQYYKVIKQ